MVDPTKPSIIYLQELIKDKILDPVCNNRSVMSPCINEIRNYMYTCGWISGEDFLSCGDVKKLFLQMVRDTVHFSMRFDVINTDGAVKELTLQTIDMNVTDKSECLTKEFIGWIEKTFTNSRYKLSDVPFMIPIHINRKSESGYIDTPIDIKHQIKFFNIDDKYQECVAWNIYSIICWDQAKQHYYTVIHQDKNNWVYLTDKEVPSVRIVHLADKYKNKIMRESVMVFYILSE